MKTLINASDIVRLRVWFSFEAHPINNQLKNDVHTTTSTYNGFISLAIVCGIDVKDFRPIPILISRYSM